MKRNLIILCVLSMCSFVLAEEKKASEPEKEKPDYRSVIVDAWLVKVDADALAKSGVKPLSEKDKENVSVMNLLWCLGEPNSGEVIISVRTRSGLNQKAISDFGNTIYISETQEASPDGRKAVTHNPYSQKIDFETYSTITENKQISISWKFNSHFIYDINNWPPYTGSIDYQNNWTIMYAGKSVIVGHSQIGNDMFFLVMRAEIVE